MSASSPLKAALAPLSHVVAAQQFDRQRLGALFRLSAEMEALRARGGGQVLPGRIMATLFSSPAPGPGSASRRPCCGWGAR